MIGRTLSHYEVVAELGAGGMGVVYRARDTLLQRSVALKVLPSDAVADESRQQRFLQEARAASALNHPHIVTIYDVIHEDGVDAIVMELIEGTSLLHRLSSGPLPPRQALSIARQIADALATAHGAGIVHRDLKPANVMITDRGHAKVLDFGIAKLDPMRGTTDEGTRTAALTMMGAVLGTAAYMSPEQARGEPVDARTDIFSLGIVLYEMLSGRSPFAASSITAVLHKLIYEEPQDISSFGVELPPGLAATVQRALAKQPAERFPTMDAMLAALDTLMAGGAVTTPHAAVMSTSTARGWRWRTGAFAAIVVAALGLAAFYGGRRAGWFGDHATPATASGVHTELPATAFEAVEQGQALLERYDREGYIDRSIDSYRRALGLKGDYPAAFAGLGMAYWRKYREQRDPMHLTHAAQNAARAVELDPQLSSGQVSLAFVKVEQGDLDAAEKTLAGTLARDPQNADALAARAYLRLRQRRNPDALEAIRAASTSRPDDWGLLLMEGVIQMSAGNPAAAVTALERASKLAPDSALVFRNLGAAYHALGKYPEATTSFQRALQITPDPAVYNNLGTLLFFRGLYDQSVDAFERAVKLNANEYRTWSNLADAYRFTPGREKDARDAYTRGLQLLDEQLTRTPGDLELASRRVAMLAKRGDCAQALPAADGLRAGAEKSSAALYRLAVAYEVCKRREPALEVLAGAIRAKYPLEQVRQDPELLALRADVRFHKFVSTLVPASAKQP
jgi:eukaryotic-like serine/threonine-protein kinase